MEQLKLIDTNAENIQNYAMCGYKNIKQEGYRLKIEWLKEQYNEGMKYIILHSDKDKAVGGIEYVPGEFAWRPVEADGYMFIHCLYIMKRQYKEQGYGLLLVDKCIEDAKNAGMKGAAVITRKGTWMASKEVFVKKGFDLVDTAKPDFELMAYKFDENNPSPKFVGDMEESLSGYKKGLTILSSDQCPYTAKAIKEISEVAEADYSIKSKIVHMKSSEEAKRSPCAFGCFCIIYEGKIVADHPVSKRRFMNIMNEELKK